MPGTASRRGIWRPRTHRLGWCRGQLDIQSGPGLADVLIGAVPMDEATQPVDLEASPGKGTRRRRLDVPTAKA
jgi:hypothetical protein